MLSKSDTASLALHTQSETWQTHSETLCRLQGGHKFSFRCQFRASSLSHKVSFRLKKKGLFRINLTHKQGQSSFAYFKSSCVSCQLYMPYVSQALWTEPIQQVNLLYYVIAVACAAKRLFKLDGLSVILLKQISDLITYPTHTQPASLIERSD